MSKYNELVSVINELYDTLNKIKAEREQLLEILRPAVDAARAFSSDDESFSLSRETSILVVDALRNAGEVLGVE